MLLKLLLLSNSRNSPETRYLRANEKEIEQKLIIVSVVATCVSEFMEMMTG